MAVCCVSHTAYINTLCGQRAAFLVMHLAINACIMLKARLWQVKKVNQRNISCPAENRRSCNTSSAVLVPSRSLFQPVTEW